MSRKLLVFTADNEDRIVFDEWTDERGWKRDEGCDFWVYMCEECRRKYAHLLGGRVSPEDGNSDWCSVSGCGNSGNYYVDFAEGEVTYMQEAD